ncbi:MAG: thioesterase family protein [Pseudomonadota bacterium]
MFKKNITPRASETNLSGHIGHFAIPVWFEDGYTEIFKLFNEDLAKPCLVTANLNMDFLHEMFFGKDVEIMTSIDRIGTSSFNVHQEVHQDGKRCVQGSTTFVYFDYSTHKPAPIPQPVYAMLKEHMSVSS